MKPIAIIAMAGRFPGARDPSALWANLRDGVESITRIPRNELERSGIDPALVGNPAYVPCKGMLDQVEEFDAALFHMSGHEAELVDPQQRIFLECAWEALEQAGYDPLRYPGAIGVWAGSGSDEYRQRQVNRNRRAREAAGDFQITIANDKDFIATRTAYKLDLRGPAVTVQAACSTSLVAVRLACQSLVEGDCDMALAGGASISLPLAAGYLHREGMILAPDGHCRAFDSRAQGTVPADAAGIVVLKPLDEALTDGDRILAVIRGFGLNNDGGAKIGFTAPSITGQADAIARAFATAGVSPDSISYVEAHGTGTALGDPIEIAALAEAFERGTSAKGFCAIGSVKTNLGHTNVAAGVTGLIKTVLSLQHKELPPSLHFECPNPEIDFSATPFYVNTSHQPWRSQGPRRAGVSSFGIGGTNVHAVLEEAPPVADGAGGRGVELIVMSAASEHALGEAGRRLGEHFAGSADIDLADAAHTLQTGRRELPFRRSVVAASGKEAAQLLADPASSVRDLVDPAVDRGVVFLFPGGGSQYPEMGHDVYDREPLFRAIVDECCAKVREFADIDLLGILYPEVGSGCSGEDRTANFYQIALFVIEYAMARLFMHWGVKPRAMVGHSVGEYAAACIAGVFTLDDALRLICERNRLVLSTAPGAMLMVPLPEDELCGLLAPGVSVAAVNGPTLTVLSGVPSAVEALAMRLTASDTACRKLCVTRGMHSTLMEPILAEFHRCVAAARPQAPAIPIVSSRTGTWLQPAEACDPAYWVGHLRDPVRFDASLGALFMHPDWVLLELGPSDVLATLARRNPRRQATQSVLTTMRRARDAQNDVAVALGAVGQLWGKGIGIDWARFRDGERRRHVELPTYAFDRQRYWIDADSDAAAEHPAQLGAPRERDISRWFYQPVWREAPLAQTAKMGASVWLVFMDDHGLGDALIEEIGWADIVTVHAGREFVQLDGCRYTIDPYDPQSYRVLFGALQEAGLVPDRIVHLWGADPVVVAACPEGSLAALDTIEARSFYSLLYLTQAIGGLDHLMRARITVVTRGALNVAESGAPAPERAVALGLTTTIPQEYPDISCTLIDLAAAMPECSAKTESRIIVDETHDGSERSAIVAYRGGVRWVRGFQPQPIATPPGDNAGLRHRGVYVITGGFGGIGLVLAEYLARTVQARLVLIGRTALPPRAAWGGATGATAECIGRIRAIEAAGGEVLALAADIGSMPEMRVALSSATERFGAIHGVIHAAGLPAGGIIQRKTKTDAARILHPKVRGTLVLAAALGEHQPDFIVSCSSLTSLLGGFGQADYCAANAFLDAWAGARADTSGTLVQSIGWDGWREVGMAARAGAVANVPEFDEFINPAEGVEVFRRALHSGLAQVTISTRDLGVRLRQPACAQTSDASARIASSLGCAARPLLVRQYVAPRTPVEEALVSLWEEYLRVAPVGVDDDFFALGGDSLLAVQLVALIHKDMGVVLPSHALVEAPTVAQLAKRFTQACPVSVTSSEQSVFVRLKAGSEDVSPLFLFHPVGGQVYIYRDLAGCLDRDQPVWGIQADGEPGSVEQLARRYVTAIRIVQPHGPYQFAGASFGGALAFEAAQQLRLAGNDVNLLAMIDTPAPHRCPETVHDDAELLAYLTGQGALDPGLLAHLRGLSEADRIAHFACVAGGKHRVSLSETEIKGFLKLWRANLRALRDYVPARYPDAVVFFRATKPDGVNRTDYDEGWRELAPDMTVHDVADTHIGINLMPAVDRVAEVLGPLLARQEAVR